MKKKIVLFIIFSLVSLMFSRVMANCPAFKDIRIKGGYFIAVSNGQLWQSVNKTDITTVNPGKIYLWRALFTNVNKNHSTSVACAYHIVGKKIDFELQPIKSNVTYKIEPSRSWKVYDKGNKRVCLALINQRFTPENCPFKMKKPWWKFW